MPKLTVATFNVNGINTRLANLLEWLAREAPDVVCLQEIKATDRQFPAGALNDAGYSSVCNGEALWNGVAILGRGVQPIVTRRALPGQDADPQARYLEAAVHGVLIAAVYVPNGNPIRGPKFAYKLAWFDALIAHARDLFAQAHPIVLAGDFNVIPTDDDVYNPRSWQRDALLQPESRARYERLLAQGWIDAVRARHPTDRIYTFWDYFRDHWKRNAGLRIDHLLVNGELSNALTGAGVHSWVRDRPHASDHAPTWITLDLARAQRAARQAAAPTRRRVRKQPAASLPAAAGKKRRIAKR
jgi:exodeoxyribonuclease III